MLRKAIFLTIAVCMAAMAGAAVVCDIPYAPENGKFGLGDLHLPEKVSPDTPVVLTIHGGGWGAGNRYSWSGVSEFFCRDLGCVAFNIEYRLASATNRWPACGDDCIKAANWLFSADFRNRAGFSPKRIYICGGSAGGHLALWTALNLPPEKVAGAISISGIADVEPDRLAHSGRYRWMIGDEMPDVNPLKMIKPNGPRLLLTHAIGDQVVPVASERNFADAYRAAGNVAEVYEYPCDIHPGLTGHCIWIPDSKPHRLIPEIESRIAAFMGGNPRSGVDVVAVYYPHWHVYPKGNEWFHPGWTEWEYVKDAKARFPGHQQPIVPLTGYLDGKNPADVAKEIDLAADAGINVFLYDYYYYGGEVTQEEAIEEGFLKAPNRNRMKFALMWCYHDRSYAWRCKLGCKKRFLMKLKRTPDEFLGMIDLSIARYFKHPEYWRRNGRLFFSLYNARDAQGRDFVSGLGADNVKAALAEARRRVRAAGLGEVEFNIQNPVSLEEVAAFKNLGFDSVTHYAGKPIRNLSERFAAGETVFDYAEVGPELKKRYAEYADAALPYDPSVSTGWDSTPRCRLDEPFPWRTKAASYPYTMTLTNCTAALFEENLRTARRFAELDSANPGFVYINAWNEYTEGCYLLPDNFEGDARLKAVRRVFAP